MITALKIIFVLATILIASALYLKKRNELNPYRYFSLVSIIFTFGSLISIVVYIITMGIPHINTQMFSLEYTTDNVTMLPSIITTLIVVVLGILIAAPVGIFTAIYLVEYAKSGSKVVEVIRLAAETLQGIPSIVYGLFGMLFFVNRINLGYSILSGVFTISIMILPLIIRSTEEALKSVDNSLREASFGLGAGKLRTIFKVVLPVAIPGILAGVVLAVGRIVGETACLIYTLGTATSLPKGLFSSSRTLALHMYMLSSEGLYVGEAYASAMVLLLVVVLLNFIATKIGNKISEVEV